MIESAVIMLVIFVLTAWAYYQDVIVGKLEFRRSRAYFGLIAAVVSYPLLTLALRYFDSIPGSWDNDTVKILVLAMAALLVIAVVLVLVHREVERKRATLLQVSRRLGFSYDPEGSSPLSPGLRQVPALESLQRVTHVFRSKEQVYESVIFEHEFSLGEDDPSQTIAVYQVSCPIPAFLLKPETLFDKFSTVLGEKDVDFSTHPTFSSVYRLVCADQDEGLVRQMFNNGLLPLFERERGWTIGCRREWVGMYKYRGVVDAEDISMFYEKTKSIANAIESAARSIG